MSASIASEWPPSLPCVSGAGTRDTHRGRGHSALCRFSSVSPLTPAAQVQADFLKEAQGSGPPGPLLSPSGQTPTAHLPGAWGSSGNSAGTAATEHGGDEGRRERRQRRLRRDPLLAPGSMVPGLKIFHPAQPCRPRQLGEAAPRRPTVLARARGIALIHLSPCRTRKLPAVVGNRPGAVPDSRWSKGGAGPAP